MANDTSQSYVLRQHVVTAFRVQGGIMRQQVPSKRRKYKSTRRHPLSQYIYLKYLTELSIDIFFSIWQIRLLSDKASDFFSGKIIKTRIIISQSEISGYILRHSICTILFNDVVLGTSVNWSRDREVGIATWNSEFDYR
jgi:hypothetical protein